jgi:hypothetical protein
LDFKKTPSFSIEVIADGYYFEPLKGSVEVLDKEEKPVVVDKADVVVPEKPTAKEPEVKKATEGHAPPTTKTTPKVPDPQTDKRVRDILAEVRTTKQNQMPSTTDVDVIAQQLLEGTKFDPRKKGSPRPVIHPRINRRLDKKVREAIETL